MHQISQENLIYSITIDVGLELISELIFAAR
jgi:hypothetical protein